MIGKPGVVVTVMGPVGVMVATTGVVVPSQTVVVGWGTPVAAAQ